MPLTLQAFRLDLLFLRASLAIDSPERREDGEASPGAATRRGRKVTHTAEGRAHSMTATSLLKKQHQEVKGLFRKIDRTEDAGARQDLMNQVIEKLTAHSTIEEEIFYPAVRGLETQKAEDVILEALEEHHVVKLVLEELPTVDPEDENFAAKMTVLSEMVEHHADEEEDDMFALAAKLGDGELETLGARMTMRMEELGAGVQESGARSDRR